MNGQRSSSEVHIIYYTDLLRASFFSLPPLFFTPKVLDGQQLFYTIEEGKADVEG